jgi:hypothetical protein
MEEDFMDMGPSSELPSQIVTMDMSSLATPPISHHVMRRYTRSKLSELDKDSHNLFVNFLKQHTCYELLPISGKIVVLDTSLLVKKAFYALQQNGKLHNSS